MNQYLSHKIILPLVATLVMVRYATEAQEPVRLLILPFHNTMDESDFEAYQEAIPALLTVLFTQRGTFSVVERNQTSPPGGTVDSVLRRKLGRQAGATVLISGSFSILEDQLMLIAHAYDVETTRLIGSREINGKAHNAAVPVYALYRALLEDLGHPLPEPASGQIDISPVANLRFMKGLNDYYSARYNRALSTFVEANRQGQTAAFGLWMAKCYIALGQYGHAYVALKRINSKDAEGVDRHSVDRLLKNCLNNLSEDDLLFYNRLLSQTED